MRSSTSSSEHANSERLTAADRPGEAQPVPERPVPPRPFGRILIAAAMLAGIMIGAWEWHWRSLGVTPGYRDDEALWAIQRRRIDQGEGEATVLTGASRTFFDVQLPVWEKLTGRRPIQLSLDGTSPVSIVEDLADDPLFKGRLLIGIAPDIFFPGFEFEDGRPQFTRKESPSQRVGKWLSMHTIEPSFAFYDDDFALFTVLRRQSWPDRPGKPRRLHVRRLQVVEADRNSYMWDRVETDAAYRDLVRRTWAQNFDKMPTDSKELADIARTRDEQIDRMTRAIAKLRAHGVFVVFVREMSAGEFLDFENESFPRAETWDVLLTKTGTPGIFYADYPQLSNFDIPDWSHMTKSSAERYTTELVGLLRQMYPEAGPW
jgi:hypothetical protein